MTKRPIRPALTWPRLAILAALSALGACAAQPPPPPYVASNPPPVPPGPGATWYHVGFAIDGIAPGPNGQPVIDQVVAFLQSNPAAVATIIGRTDTVGSPDYNMRLSHRRADGVRDAIVYGGHIAAGRVETRWTGESRLQIATADEVAASGNRVVDIAIH